MPALKALVSKYPKTAGLLVVLVAAAAAYYGIPPSVVTGLSCALAGAGC